MDQLGLHDTSCSGINRTRDLVDLRPICLLQLGYAVSACLDQEQASQLMPPASVTFLYLRRDAVRDHTSTGSPHHRLGGYANGGRKLSFPANGAKQLCHGAHRHVKEALFD